jgi:hypothetical protein
MSHSGRVLVRLLGIMFTNAISCFEPGPQEPYWNIFTAGSGCIINLLDVSYNVLTASLEFDLTATNRLGLLMHCLPQAIG